MATSLARRGQFRAAPKIRYRTRLVRAGRTGLTAAARAARTEKHTFAAVGAAAVLGFMKRSGVTLPKVEALGTAGTYGALAWAAGRYMKSQTLQHVATGLLSVAAVELASGIDVSGDEDTISGDFDVEGDEGDE